MENRELKLSLIENKNEEELISEFVKYNNCRFYLYSKINKKEYPEIHYYYLNFGLHLKEYELYPNEYIQDDFKFYWLNNFQNYVQKVCDYNLNFKYQAIWGRSLVEKIIELTYSTEKLKALKQLKEARKKQVQKIKKHIAYYIYNPDYSIYFLTFTKKNDDLKTKTFKDYITQGPLKSVTDYILNIDYGSKNEREHFHALIFCQDEFCDLKPIEAYKVDKRVKNKNLWEFNHPDFQAYKSKVGFYYAEKLGREEKDITCVAKYIDKLTLHSIKVKQSYVSVKKGSPYQVVKGMVEKLVKANSREKTVYDDKNISLRDTASISRIFKQEIKDDYKPLYLTDNDWDLFFVSFEEYLSMNNLWEKPYNK